MYGLYKSTQTNIGTFYVNNCQKSADNPLTMNKTLLLILIPCVVAFVMVQVQAQGYGGYYGYPGYYPRARAYGYGYARGARRNNNQALYIGFLFFISILFLNLTGSYRG